MSEPSTPADVVGSWVHAHERDHDDVQVFVPADTPLPPSRGRQGFALEPDGAARTSGPGADDRTVATDGHWDVRDGRLGVYLGAGSTLHYDISSATPAELVLRPVLPID